MINVTTLIFKLSIFQFYSVMHLVLHPMESISLNSFVLLEQLAMLLTSLSHEPFSLFHHGVLI